MMNAVIVSSGRTVEQLIEQGQTLSTPDTMHTALEKRTFRATNPKFEGDKAEGNIFDLLGVGVPLGPIAIVASLGLNVGESWEAGPVKIERKS